MQARKMLFTTIPSMFAASTKKIAAFLKRLFLNLCIVVLAITSLALFYSIYEVVDPVTLDALKDFGPQGARPLHMQGSPGGHSAGAIPWGGGAPADNIGGSDSSGSFPQDLPPTPPSVVANEPAQAEPGPSNPNPAQALTPRAVAKQDLRAFLADYGTKGKTLTSFVDRTASELGIDKASDEEVEKIISLIREAKTGERSNSGQNAAAALYLDFEQWKENRRT